MVSWFRYVTHARVEEFEAAGWVIAGDLGPVHGYWSVLMRFTGEGEPPAEAAGASPRPDT